MLKAAAYCRVSTDRDDQSNSFASQQQYFREYIARQRDWTLVGIYADEGLSGTSTRQRAQFRAMIAEAMAGHIDLILTKEVSRFARNTVDALQYTRMLRERGVGVLFLLDHIDTRSSDGELRLTLMASIAQEESRRTSERVKWGQRRRMEQGVVFGASLLGYRVAGGQITVEPSGAAVVREIFRLYLQEGKGGRAIAGELEKSGVPAASGTCRWSAATVLKILRNEKYCGDLVQKKTCTPDYLTHTRRKNRGEEELVVLRDHHEAIIPRAEFEAVQRELRRRCTHTPASGHGSRLPLSGKILCGECGAAFHARTKYQKQRSYRIWRCGTASVKGNNNTGCNVGRQLRQEQAMQILRQTASAVAFDREAVMRHLSGIIESSQRRAALERHAEADRLRRSLSSVKEKRLRAADAFLSGQLTDEEFSAVKRRYDGEIAACTERIDALLSGESDGAAALRRASPASYTYAAACDELLLCALLDHMTVYHSGRVEVTLRYLPFQWTYLLAPSVGDAEGADSFCLPATDIGQQPL